MNVLDHARTPLWSVWERVAELAKSEGVAVAGLGAHRLDAS